MTAEEPLFQTIAAKVKQDLLDPENPSGLPSIEELSRLYHVSYMTMWKALDSLAGQGVVSRRQGRRTVVAGSDRPSALKASSDTLRARIADDIVNGVYRTGRALPKIGWFTSTHRISRNTVVHVLSSLCEEGLIHKQGRRWLVGPAPSSSAPVPSASRTGTPVVILHMPDEMSWLITFNNTFFTPFVSALRNELLNKGVLLSVVLRSRPSQGSSFVHWGIDSARSCIRKWGGSYLGGLVMDITPRREQFLEWVKVLSCDGDRPVVYFDSSSTRPRFTRPALRLGDWYYRSSMNEREGMRLVLEHLVNLGHRKVAFPVFAPSVQTWASERLALFRELAESATPSLEILSSEMAEPFWDSDLLGFDPESIIGFNTRLQRHANVLGAGAGRTRSVRRKMIERTSSLTSVLREGATALVAMNDRIAYQFMWWAAAVGIDIPRDLSLVGFDNNAESETLPLSTVDLGFARTGYLTAHVLFGDIPVKTDKYGNIPAVSTLVDRGSTAAPADGERLRQLIS